MVGTGLVDQGRSDRELIRQLRSGVAEDDTMPESVAWHLFLELRRRGEPTAVSVFVQTLRTLLARRSLGAARLPMVDVYADEHRLVEDTELFLADLWKAYKRCLQNNRTGPADQLLRDIEEQLLRAGPVGP